MADLADDADRTIEQNLQRQLAMAAGAGPVIAPRGYCLFCGAKELPDGSAWPSLFRWCDSGCREDWTRHTGVR